MNEKLIFTSMLLFGLLLVSSCEEASKSPLFTPVTIYPEETFEGDSLFGGRSDRGISSPADPIACQFPVGGFCQETGDSQFPHQIVCEEALGCHSPESCFVEDGNNYCGSSSYGGCYCIGDGVCHDAYGETAENSPTDGCSGAVVCNNDGVRDAGEDCDGSDLPITSCSVYNSALYESGTLSCTSSCTYDTSNCVPVSGGPQPGDACGSGTSWPVGTTMPCDTGNLGVCKDGIISCLSTNVFGSCIGDVSPGEEPEDCSAVNEDNDCDGAYPSTDSDCNFDTVDHIKTLTVLQNFGDPIYGSLGTNETYYGEIISYVVPGQRYSASIDLSGCLNTNCYSYPTDVELYLCMKDAIDDSSEWECSSPKLVSDIGGATDHREVVVSLNPSVSDPGMHYLKVMADCAMDSCGSYKGIAIHSVVFFAA